MKNLFKTLAVILVVSMITFSCDNKNDNEPNDPTNTNKEISVNSENLQGNWILTNWVCSDGSDMSYTLGKKISFFEDGTMYMPTEEWEDLMPIYNQWAYSSVNKNLIFSAEGEESMVFLVKSFTENVLVLEYTADISYTLTFEKQ